MRIKIFAFIVWVCASLAAHAEEKPRDGVFWRSMPDTSRTFYVVGLLDGLIGGDFLMPSKTPESLSAYHQKLQEIIGKSTVGTLKDGLDKFYEDFRNRNIKIYRAIGVVSAQINGISDEKVQRMIEHLRQWKDQ